jgi:hypothetical protein
LRTGFIFRAWLRLRLGAAQQDGSGGEPDGNQSGHGEVFSDEAAMT